MCKVVNVYHQLASTQRVNLFNRVNLVIKETQEYVCKATVFGEAQASPLIQQSKFRPTNSVGDESGSHSLVP